MPEIQFARKTCCKLAVASFEGTGRYRKEPGSLREGVLLKKHGEMCVCWKLNLNFTAITKSFSYALRI